MSVSYFSLLALLLNNFYSTFSVINMLFGNNCVVNYAIIIAAIVMVIIVAIIIVELKISL